MRALNQLFLFSRWIILVPVLSLLVGCGYFTWQIVLEVYRGIIPNGNTTGRLLAVIQAVESSLLCAVLFLFSLGLFIDNLVDEKVTSESIGGLEHVFDPFR